MSFINNMKSKKVLKSIAAEEGKTLAQIEAAIQDSIDIAWNSPEFHDIQMQYFPNGKPSPEEFIAVVAKQVKDKRK